MISGSIDGLNLRILTLNAFLRPPGITSYFRPEKDAKDERLLEIGEVIEGYDIVMLQEIFNASLYGNDLVKQRTTDLVCRARRHGLLYFARSSEPKYCGGGIADSGLLILSRYPIVESGSYSYVRGKGPDICVEKSILYARIIVRMGSFSPIHRVASNDDGHSLGGTSTVHVFTTHTQSGDSKPQAVLRAAQLKTLSQLVAEKVPPGDTAVIGGDLNLDALHDVAYPADGGSPVLLNTEESTDYRAFIDQLRGLNQGRAVLDCTREAIVNPGVCDLEAERISRARGMLQQQQLQNYATADTFLLEGGGRDRGCSACSGESESVSVPRGCSSPSSSPCSSSSSSCSSSSCSSSCPGNVDGGGDGVSTSTALLVGNKHSNNNEYHLTTGGWDVVGDLTTSVLRGKIEAMLLGYGSSSSVAKFAAALTSTLSSGGGAVVNASPGGCGDGNLNDPSTTLLTSGIGSSVPDSVGGGGGGGASTRKSISNSGNNNSDSSSGSGDVGDIELGSIKQQLLCAASGDGSESGGGVVADNLFNAPFFHRHRSQRTAQQRYLSLHPITTFGHGELGVNSDLRMESIDVLRCVDYIFVLPPVNVVPEVDAVSTVASGAPDLSQTQTSQQQQPQTEQQPQQANGTTSPPPPPSPSGGIATIASLIAAGVCPFLVRSRELEGVVSSVRGGGGGDRGGDGVHDDDDDDGKRRADGAPPVPCAVLSDHFGVEAVVTLRFVEQGGRSPSSGGLPVSGGCANCNMKQSVVEMNGQLQQGGQRGSVQPQRHHAQLQPQQQQHLQLQAQGQKALLLHLQSLTSAFPPEQMNEVRVVFPAVRRYAPLFMAGKCTCVGLYLTLWALSVGDLGLVIACCASFLWALSTLGLLLPWSLLVLLWHAGRGMVSAVYTGVFGGAVLRFFGWLTHQVTSSRGVAFVSSGVEELQPLNHRPAV